MTFYMIEWRRKSAGNSWQFDFENCPRMTEMDANRKCDELNATHKDEPKGDEYRVRKAKLFPLKGT